MTDVPTERTSIPTRLGMTWTTTGDQLSGRLEAPPGICERGVLPAYAVVFLADALAGVTIDTDPDAWAFTTDLSVWLPVEPAPAVVEATTTVLRDGARSSTCEVPLTVDGRSWGGSFASFARVPRRPEDPEKVAFDGSIAERARTAAPLEVPLRDAAGFRSVDPATGSLAVELVPDLLNPAGAMQGAMVAGLAEAAATDLADHHLAMGTDRHVVTEIHVRYLVQNRTSPIASRARFVGAPTDGRIRVDLLDDGGTGRLTTAVVAKVAPAPS